MTDLTSFIKLSTDLGLKAISLLGVIAFLIFVFGVAKFIRSTGDEKAVKDGKSILIWGVVALFVLFTVWGIVSFLQGEFGFGSDVGIPQVKIK